MTLSVFNGQGQIYHVTCAEGGGGVGGGGGRGEINFIPYLNDHDSVKEVGETEKTMWSYPENSDDNLIARF